MKQEKNNQLQTQAASEITKLKALQPKALSERLITALISHNPKEKTNYKIVAAQLTPGGVPDFRAILDAGTQISVLKAAKGDQFLVSVLALVITDFCHTFNVIRPMVDDQIADLAIEITVDYWAYKLEDFISFFHAAKKGRYNSQVKILDRLDAPIIYSMLKIYDQERMEYVQRRQFEFKDTQDNADPYGDHNIEARGVTSVAGALGALKENFKSLPIQQAGINIENGKEN